MNASDPFIGARTVDIRLRDQTPVRIRPIVPDDDPKLVEGLEELSLPDPATFDSSDRSTSSTVGNSRI
ncbi:hypothetical protein BMS3Abin02_01965 [bacterium BMS3Abin02]|nr:hypothetical protein BMS3Abin02_01965 [bacterium BMS3Abin02]GBE21171.1 hypothetical protein BMS3Bbin01_00512 [bacterium BMS3Bbin01]HDH25027.1 hypothetical protein [Actinomycetota bacterium]HDK45665.1 hypothetical protein [Actinomycetota bacterium]HDL49372.1 hypothetical protein [Actinomycetota bacterium]